MSLSAATAAENVAAHKGVRHRVPRVAAEFQAFFVPRWR